MVGLSSAALHDVPDWRGRKLRRGIVNIVHVGYVSIGPVQKVSVVGGEGDGAAVIERMLEIVYFADIDLKGVASKAIVRSLKVLLAYNLNQHNRK